MNGGQRNGTNGKYGESKTTRIMMATVPHVTSGLGPKKFQADGFLLTRVYLPATEVMESSPPHGLHCLRFLLFILSASSHRIRSRSEQATTLTCTSFAEHEVFFSSYYSKLYGIKYKYCLIRVKFSSVRPFGPSIVLFSSFFQKRTVEFSLFWQQATTDRQHWSPGLWLCTNLTLLGLQYRLKFLNI